jgi:hypothetical protein
MGSRFRGNSRSRNRGSSRGRFEGNQARTENGRSRPYGQASRGEHSYGERPTNYGPNTYGPNRGRSTYDRTDHNLGRQDSRNNRDNPPRQEPVVKNQDPELHSVLTQISNALLTLAQRVEAIENHKGLDKSVPVTRPKPVVSARPLLYNTTNDDFVSVSKGLYKLVQIGHHATNWERLPKSIDERLQKLVADINPPMCDDKFRVELRSLTQSYGEEVRRLVSDHLLQKRTETEVMVGSLNATDIDHAKEIASKHIVARLGRRLTEQRRTTLMNTAASKVGVYRCAPPRIATMDTTSWTTVTRKTPPGVGKPEVSVSARKRKITSKGSTPVSNQFEVLNDECIALSENEMESGVSPTPGVSATVGQVLKKVRRTLDAPTQRGVHIHTGKKTDWRIEADNEETSLIVIGDSNLRKVRTIPKYWQYNALPGAHFEHVTDVIRHLSGKPGQFSLIIQAGINHRATFGPAEEDEARSMLLEAHRNPAVDEVFFNGVSIPADLGSDDADRLNSLNRFMESELGADHYLTPLHQLEVNVDSNDSSGIHYNQNTVDLITREMIRKVNGTVF